MERLHEERFTSLQHRSYQSLVLNEGKIIPLLVGERTVV